MLVEVFKEEFRQIIRSEMRVVIREIGLEIIGKEMIDIRNSR